MLNLRYFLFFVYDCISGNVVQKHIDDVHEIVSRPESNYSKIEIAKRKQKIIEHAIKNVPYYKKMEFSKENPSLNNFPVVDKNVIRNNFDSFTSVNYKKKLIKVVTSGSTGTPFSIYHDYPKKKRNTADTIYFSGLAGYKLGIKLNYMKIWTVINKKTKFNAFVENINQIDVTKLSDSVIKELIQNINSNKNKKAFLSYASALESICKYLDKNNPTLTFSNVVSVIAMSESLTDYTKLSIKKYFKKHPVSRYSNVENGILAQQLDDGSNSFIVNWASYYIEILALDSDNPVELGQIGRIVVTDYFNYATPMIRYDTGDIGVMNWNQLIDKKVLTKIEGRKMDLIYDTNGKLVSSFTITNNMWMYPEIIQYQFIQLSDKDYLFKLNLDKDFKREDMLIAEFKNYLGFDANIKTEYVNEIPLLNSGKRKKVMNLNLK